MQLYAGKEEEARRQQQEQQRQVMRERVRPHLHPKQVEQQLEQQLQLQQWHQQVLLQQHTVYAQQPGQRVSDTGCEEAEPQPPPSHPLAYPPPSPRRQQPSTAPTTHGLSGTAGTASLGVPSSPVSHSPRGAVARPRAQSDMRPLSSGPIPMGDLLSGARDIVPKKQLKQQLKQQEQQRQQQLQQRQPQRQRRASTNSQGVGSSTRGSTRASLATSPHPTFFTPSTPPTRAHGAKHTEPVSAWGWAPGTPMLPPFRSRLHPQPLTPSAPPRTAASAAGPRGILTAPAPGPAPGPSPAPGGLASSIAGASSGAAVGSGGSGFGPSAPDGEGVGWDVFPQHPVPLLPLPGEEAVRVLLRPPSTASTIMNMHLGGSAGAASSANVTSGGMGIAGSGSTRPGTAASVGSGFSGAPFSPRVHLEALSQLEGMGAAGGSGDAHAYSSQSYHNGVVGNAVAGYAYGTPLGRVAEGAEDEGRAAEAGTHSQSLWSSPAGGGAGGGEGGVGGDRPASRSLLCYPPSRIAAAAAAAEAAESAARAAAQVAHTLQQREGQGAGPSPGDQRHRVRVYMQGLRAKAPASPPGLGGGDRRGPQRGSARTGTAGGSEEEEGQAGAADGFGKGAGAGLGAGRGAGQVPLAPAPAVRVGASIVGLRATSEGGAAAMSTNLVSGSSATSAAYAAPAFAATASVLVPQLSAVEQEGEGTGGLGQSQEEHGVEGGRELSQVQEEGGGEGPGGAASPQHGGNERGGEEGEEPQRSTSFRLARVSSSGELPYGPGQPEASTVDSASATVAAAGDAAGGEGVVTAPRPVSPAAGTASTAHAVHGSSLAPTAESAAFNPLHGQETGVSATTPTGSIVTAAAIAPATAAQPPSSPSRPGTPSNGVVHLWGDPQALVMGGVGVRGTIATPSPTYLTAGLGTTLQGPLGRRAGANGDAQGGDAAAAAKPSSAHMHAPRSPHGKHGGSAATGTAGAGAGAGVAPSHHAHAMHVPGINISQSHSHAFKTMVAGAAAAPGAGHGAPSGGGGGGGRKTWAGLAITPGLCLAAAGVSPAAKGRERGGWVAPQSQQQAGGHEVGGAAAMAAAAAAGGAVAAEVGAEGVEGAEEHPAHRALAVATAAIAAGQRRPGSRAGGGGGGGSRPGSVAGLRPSVFPRAAAEAALPTSAGLQGSRR